MDLAESLAYLQSRISEALRHVPGASTLYLFGSCATPYADPYADIDMQLVSVNIPAARAVWPTILENVGAIETAWPITAEADATAYSVLLHSVSLYHKLDIGISTPAEAERLFGTGNGCITLWTQNPTPPVTVEQRTEAYVPTYGGIGHTLIGELMSAVRYVKARKRQHYLTCWRFIRGKPDLLIALLDEQTCGWTTEKAKLTTWDYKALDQQSGHGSKRLHDVLDWSTPASMDRSMWMLMTYIAALLREKAEARHEHIPAALIECHLSFIQAELGVQPFDAAPFRLWDV